MSNLENIPIDQQRQKRLDNLPPQHLELLLKRIAKGNSLPPASEKVVQLTPWLTAQRRPLLDLIASGELPMVDTVSLTCVSDRRLPNGKSFGEVFSRARGDLPIVTRIMHTPYGRIATVVLPRTYAEIYLKEKMLVQVVGQAIKMAQMIGARTISLTGLIPSATNYGRDIVVDQDMPSVTTGHATTTSSVVLSIKQLLDLSGRHLSAEHVAFVGLGSVGSSTLKLMLQALPHPKELTLCDLFSKREDIDRLIEQIVAEFSFQGKIRFVPSTRQVGDEIYDATVIVGATNVPGVIEVARLMPGTLVVDDSAPHCYDADEAIIRMKTAADVLFSEGGFLRLQETIAQDLYYPEEANGLLTFHTKAEAAKNITGCNLSSLLSHRFGLPRTLGQVLLDDARQHLAALARLKIEAALPHCGDHYISPEEIKKFNGNFGSSETVCNELKNWVMSAPSQVEKAVSMESR